MNRFCVFMMCAVCAMSCSSGPKGIVEEYYTQIKKRNYEKVAEIAIEHFWETERLGKNFDKPDGEEDRAEMISDMVKLLEEVGFSVKDFEFLEMTDKDFKFLDTSENDAKKEGKTFVKIKTSVEKENYRGEKEIDESTYIYTFEKKKDKWVAVERSFAASNPEILNE